MFRLNTISFSYHRLPWLSLLVISLLLCVGCSGDAHKSDTGKALLQLIVLAPGHFHAALLQKTMYPQVDSTVQVYAPEGREVDAYLSLIQQYNTRPDHPTAWKEELYKGDDFFEKMLAEKKGTVVVLAGNNQSKTNYISRSVEAGMNVLADKPMAINPAGFAQLQKAFEEAETKKVLLYDIMTSRYDITNLLQRAFSQLPEVFGNVETGTPENPAVVSQSVHHFFKQISGKPLVRPAWYYDVQQQGEGIVDVTTHMIDLVQWTCFPEQVIDYRKDITLNKCRRWPTVLSPAQFNRSTNATAYPDFLKKDVSDSLLSVFANGEINYTIRNVHAKVSVVWNYEAPEGGADTHYGLLRGTKCNLVVQQGAEQQYKPVLYIEPVNADDAGDWEKALTRSMDGITRQYPGVTLEKEQNKWKVIIPEKYKIDHEQQFSLVAEKYLSYLEEKKMPAWETAAMLSKYYITTEALVKASATK